MSENTFNQSISWKKILTQEILEALYIYKEMSKERIGELFGFNSNIVNEALQHYNITKDQRKTKIKINRHIINKNPIRKRHLFTKEELEHLYLDQGIHVDEMAKIFSCSNKTIIKHLKLHNIDIRFYQPKRTFTEEELFEEYITKDRTLDDIGKEYNCTGGNIMFWARKYGIYKSDYKKTMTPQEARDKENARRRKKRKEDPVWNFSNRISRCLRQQFKRCNLTKGGRTFKLLGYTPEDLHNHLKQWIDCPCEVCGCDYSDDFHIDHIKPVSLAKTEAEIIELNFYTNLRLICKTCNLEKFTTF